MSGLAGLLAGHREPGVYHWNSAVSVDDVRHTVESAGWRFVGLDTWAVSDKAEFLGACKRSFEFPEWVGSNFDALADALTDVRAEGEAGVVVLWRGWSRLACEHPRTFAVALNVFAGRVEFRPGGPFAVLLQSREQSDLGLPELDAHASLTAEEETEHLLRVPANAKRLIESLEQARTAQREEHDLAR